MEETPEAPAATPRAAGRRSAWLVPGGLLLLLVFLTVNVLANGPLVAVDRHVRSAVHAQATSAAWRWLASGRFAPAQIVTDLGSVKIAGVVLAVCAIAVAVRHRSLRPLLVAAAGGALLAATDIPAKILIGRPGPGFTSLPPGAWGEFPSGHASTAGVCYGLAALLLTAGPQAFSGRGRLPGLPQRRAAAAVTVAICFLVGAALVWCDYHWLTDVVAGWTLAALIVWIVWRAQRLWPGSWQLRKAGPAERDTALTGHSAKEHDG
jgi:membrane-associated phospholipid phosphatase